jgi:hypothetical protein
MIYHDQIVNEHFDASVRGDTLQQQRFAFSGRMGSGKDYIAQQIGAKIYGFADPIYRMSEYFLGTQDKSIHEVRKFLQYVGQIGRGVMSTDYPVSPERCLFVQMIRDRYADIFESYPEFIVHDDNKNSLWFQYGRNADFWIEIFKKRIERLTQPSPVIAVVGVRFENELAALKSLGFKHYHVSCSEETRKARLGVGYSAKNDADLSEKMAIAFSSGSMLADNYIWNDASDRYGIHGLPIDVVTSGVMSMDAFINSIFTK